MRHWILFVCTLLLQPSCLLIEVHGQNETFPSPGRLEEMDIPASLDPVLADLDSAEWAVRESASKRLLDPALSPETIMAIVQRRRLSEEARARLLGALI